MPRVIPPASGGHTHPCTRQSSVEPALAALRPCGRSRSVRGGASPHRIGTATGGDGLPFELDLSPPSAVAAGLPLACLSATNEVPDSEAASPAATDMLTPLLQSACGTVVVHLLTQVDLAHARRTARSTRGAVDATVQNTDGAFAILRREVLRLHTQLERVTAIEQDMRQRLAVAPAGVDGCLVARRPDRYSPWDVRRAVTVSAVMAASGVASTIASAVEAADVVSDPAKRGIWGALLGVVATGSFVASRSFTLQAAAFRRSLLQQDQAEAGAQVLITHAAFHEAVADFEEAWTAAIRELEGDQDDGQDEVAPGRASLTPNTGPSFGGLQSVVEDRV